MSWVGLLMCIFHIQWQENSNTGVRIFTHLFYWVISGVCHFVFNYEGQLHTFIKNNREPQAYEQVFRFLAFRTANVGVKGRSGRPRGEL